MNLRRLTTPRRALILLLMVTATQRAWVAWTSFQPTADNGSVGLMALHIMEGARPLFLYGFNYSGALVPYVMAGIFQLLGVSLITFVLTGILFTLGWVVVTYLFFKELYGTHAGLVAALCLALPDLVTSWYSLAPDCSYTPMFFLGTSILLLSYRIASHDVMGRALWSHAVALGALAGLALWTHMLAVLYLLFGAAFLVPFFFRHRFRFRVLVPFVVGVVPLVLFLTPYLFTEGEGGSVSSRWRPFGSAIRGHVSILFNDSLPNMYTWPHPRLGAWQALGALLVCALLAAYACGVVVRTRRWRACFPAAFVVVFLLFYLPHALAAEAAPRYLVAPWAILTCGAFAVACSAEGRFVRRAAHLLLALWVGYHAASAVVNGLARRPNTAAARAGYERIVQDGLQVGATHVMLLDEYEFAANGQTLRFLAGDAVRFVAANEERHQAAAQSADLDADAAFAATQQTFARFTNALLALDATWERLGVGQLDFARDVVLPRRGRRSVDPATIAIAARHAVSGHPLHLLDRAKDTMLMGRYDRESHIEMDLGRERKLNGLLLVPTTKAPLGLPAGYRVEGSLDGASYQLLKEVRGSMPFVQRLADRIFAGGGYGWQECSFQPTSVRYLRITPTEAYRPANIWYVSELYLLEDAPATGGDAVEERERIASFLRGEKVSFTYADRWVSAALVGNKARVYDDPPAYPRYNEHLRIVGAKVPFGVRRFRPRTDEAMVVDLAFASECERLLGDVYGPDLSWKRYGFGRYALFLFDKTPETDRWLWWNGFMPLKMF